MTAAGRTVGVAFAVAATALFLSGCQGGDAAAAMVRDVEDLSRADAAGEAAVDKLGNLCG